jgi:hypothetical protein
MIEEPVLILGLVGGVGAVVSVLIAVLPQTLEWYYDWKNQPLKVEVVKALTRVNPSIGGLLRLRVRNRLRIAINVTVSPATSVTVATDGLGKVSMKGTLFDEPEPTVYPSHEKAWSFWLPGHDSREIELRLPVTQGILRGKESVSPIVFANRFRVQQIRLGPFEFEVDPTFT